MTNFEKLTAIRKERKLTNRRIAEITQSQLTTVRNWFNIDRKTGKPHRNVPDSKIKLLEMVE